MINFFKKLFAAIFGKKKSSPSHKKPIVEEPVVLLDEMKMPKESQQPEPKNELVKEKKFFPFSGRKKWQMRNNRLHVRFYGKIESMKCNKVSRAHAIISRFRKEGVQYAVFTDKEGNQYQLV